MSPDQLEPLDPRTVRTALNAAKQIVQQWPLLEDVKTSVKKQSGNRSARPNERSPMRLAVLDLQLDAADLTDFVIRTLVDEQPGWKPPRHRGPRGKLLALTRDGLPLLLQRHGAQDDVDLAESLAEELTTLAERAEQILDPPARRFTIPGAYCTVPVPCGGALYAALDPDETQPGELKCTRDHTHTIPRDRWALTGARIQQENENRK